MSLIPLAMLGSAPAVEFGVANSGVFAAEDPDILTRTYGPTSATWTFSCWVKRVDVGSIMKLLGDEIKFNADDTITAEGLTTGEVFRDVAEFCHICVGTDLWINGDSIGSVTTTAITSSSIGTTLSGYLSEVYFIDGSALTPTDFAEEDAVTKQWNPIEYTGSYGTEGFYLNFQDGSELGKDTSGNGNTFTNSGVTQSADIPTNNHCILVVTDTLTTAAITNAGLTSASGNAKVSIRPVTGKWYYEKGGVGVNYDTSVSGQFDPVLTADDYVFVEDDWVGTPTAGHLALSTSNMPESDIPVSGEAFKGILYDDGAGAKTVGFQPDMVWFKSRGTTNSHKLVDSTRGATISIRPDTNPGNLTEATGLTSFDVNGFTVGADANYSNQTGDGMVAWSWLEGITQGLDIIAYSGDGVAGRTIPHNLGAVPELMVIKGVAGTFNVSWRVFHHESRIGDPAKAYLQFDLTTGLTVRTNIFNDTEPTSSVFTVGDHFTVNSVGFDYIAYIFTSIEGFSKFVRYTGNGSANGPFVHLGFRPAFLIMKSLASASWVLLSSSTNPYNIAENYLFVDLPNTEAVGIGVDFLSNGFKLRTNSSAINNNASTYVCIAFAESPFKYGRAR